MDEGDTGDLLVESLTHRHESSLNTMVIYGPEDQILGVITPDRNPGAGKCLWTIRFVDGEHIQVGPFHKRQEVWEAFIHLVEDEQIVFESKKTLQCNEQRL